MGLSESPQTDMWDFSSSQSAILKRLLSIEERLVSLESHSSVACLSSGAGQRISMRTWSFLSRTPIKPRSVCTGPPGRQLQGPGDLEAQPTDPSATDMPELCVSMKQNLVLPPCPDPEALGRRVLGQASPLRVWVGRPRFCGK